MLLRLLRTYLGRHRRDLTLVIVFQALQTLATLYLPSLNADIIDKGIATGDRDYIWRTGGVMLAVTLFQVLCATAAVYFGARTAMAFGRDVRDGLFRQVSAFSAQEVGQLGAPSLITRITNDVTQVQMFVLMTCTLLVAAPITCVGGIVLALREDVGLSWILTVSIPVLVGSIGIVVWRMVPQFRVMQERIDRVNQVLREQITGIRVVRAFVREPAERERFGTVNRDVTETALRAGQLQAFMFPIVLLVLNGSSVAVLWFGAGRIESGQMRIGALIAFLSYLTQILLAVMMATFLAVLAPRAAVCAERINEVLDTPSSVVIAESPRTELSERGSLELRGVGFHYPGAEQPVLTGIDLRAVAGQTTAVIGSTGSGKTTLLGLIPRLFDATAGSVLVDGVDVRELDPQVLWRRVGLVPQKPFLFSGTVRSNLAFADPAATDDDLWSALTVAQADDFVRAMPGGLDAPITQGGANVSGGQRQRLAIARALVRRPEIYLFDDSFSALDLATDARLRAALAPRTADATVVIVAQRVSTIRGADQILVLEDGHVVGLGTHADLLAGCPTYQEIVASQLSAEEAAA
ncbi:MAG TPA: ABC transporter ATP-binding protein [Aquihabitans sp.]|jgi:ATP-binding cassette subfamily B protein|nr:ABC transporter ATP-binding protein [Aquihabitans sp.]